MLHVYHKQKRLLGSVKEKPSSGNCGGNVRTTQRQGAHFLGVRGENSRAVAQLCSAALILTMFCLCSMFTHAAALKCNAFLTGINKVVLNRAQHTQW